MSLALTAGLAWFLLRQVHPAEAAGESRGLAGLAPGEPRPGHGDLLPEGLALDVDPHAGRPCGLRAGLLRDGRRVCRQLPPRSGGRDHPAGPAFERYRTALFDPSGVHPLRAPARRSLGLFLPRPGNARQALGPRDGLFGCAGGDRGPASRGARRHRGPLLPRRLPPAAARAADRRPSPSGARPVAGVGAVRAPGVSGRLRPREEADRLAVAPGRGRFALHVVRHQPADRVRRESLLDRPASLGLLCPDFRRRARPDGPDARRDRRLPRRRGGCSHRVRRSERHGARRGDRGARHLVHTDRLDWTRPDSGAESQEERPGTAIVCGHEVPVLRLFRRSRRGLPGKPGGRGHPSPAGMRLLWKAIHVVRDDRGDSLHGRQERRPQGDLRPEEAAGRPGQKACEKRPVPPARLDAIVDEIETLLHEVEERELPTSRIGALVMERLRELDKVAYVRFASVYRKFEDVDEFLHELKSLIDRAETKAPS